MQLISNMAKVAQRYPVDNRNVPKYLPLRGVESAVVRASEGLDSDIGRMCVVRKTRSWYHGESGRVIFTSPREHKHVDSVAHSAGVRGV